jgi:ubiquinone/menaquinone biosynthesis C-methylase UbiE
MLNPEVIDFYEDYDEIDRLDGFSIEKIRTQELILRHLNGNSLRILDIGGGTGVYSFWLSSLGHQVHLIDALPKHVKQARDEAAQNKLNLQSIKVGDARDLEFPDNYFDAILMFGPLYHLTKKQSRLRALNEAQRVLKPEGIIFAAIISRYSSMFEGFLKDYISDPEFVEIISQDLENGQHRNPTNMEEYFTTAFFHLPAVLKLEMKSAGFSEIQLFAVEGFTEIISDIKTKIKNPTFRKTLLRTLRETERAESIMGISNHVMGVGRKH